MSSIECMCIFGCTPRDCLQDIDGAYHQHRAAPAIECLQEPWLAGAALFFRHLEEGSAISALWLHSGEVPSTISVELTKLASSNLAYGIVNHSALTTPHTDSQDSSRIVGVEG
ncbi:hypothetical protein HRR85_002458 [Exophiala dermatitidis]|nr:hypothetical protein HRR85_002458 [Exophiala dermatitidis]